MSGGFFRGTSAEQDTRFSNKQAKLLKTQKFAPELDHLVDVTKVKMDVIRPWIAKRVTELLGFEDEVLINFIYGLLEGKEINGKEVQIQLTGFMEKYTGKFMKELWSLLLSAQKNASGVPQQFLDAKEDETRKKKEELEWIGNEVQKRKEKGSMMESEHVNSKMDGGVINDSTMEPKSKDILVKDSKFHSDDEKAAGARNGFKRRDSKAFSRSGSKSYSNSRSYSDKALSRSGRKSYSNSRSYSEERNSSRTISRSPCSRKHSISSERKRRRSQRSLSLVRRRSCTELLSPTRRSSPRRRSTSRSRFRYASPLRRRVRSPERRRSPSLLRRRSHGRRRSRSTLQHRSRSPQWRWSPSPWRRRSPSPWWRRSHSPWRRRPYSPQHRCSPSPWRCRSPSPRQRPSAYPPRRHRRSLSSLSPVNRKPPPSRQGSPSPMDRRLSSQASICMRPSPLKRRARASAQARSPTPLDRLSSPHSWSSSPARRRSHSPSEGKVPMLKRSASRSPRDRLRSPEQSSPGYQRTQKERSVTLDEAYKGRDSRVSARCMPSISLSPRRAHRGGTNLCKKVPSLSSSPRKSFSNSRLSPRFKDQTPSEGRGEDREYKSKFTQRSIRSPSQKSMDSPEKSSGRRHHDDIYWRKKEKEIKSEEVLLAEVPASRKSIGDNSSSHEKPSELSLRDDMKEGKEIIKKDDLNRPTLGFARSEGSSKHKKMKHRKSSRCEVGSDSSRDDSEVEDRMESKRRRKEEKKLRKRERRRLREERWRRKEEKRAQKRKRRSRDSGSLSSDSDKHENDVNVSGGDRVAGMESYSSGKEETELEKKRLENELREKALQKLRAKKGISR